MVIVERRDGSRWRLGPPIVTSDGYKLATGVLIDEEDKDVIDDGFPVTHSFFLG